MKTALVILPACLLALAHLNGAQLVIEVTLGLEDSCPSVKELSLTCKKEYVNKDSGEKEANNFCTSGCSEAVLKAYQDCKSDEAPAFANGVKEGEKIRSH